MDFSPPKWVTDAADEALRNVASNHYSHPRGRIHLQEAIKDFYGPSFGRDLDIESEIIVTSGANEGKSNISPPYFHSHTCNSGQYSVFMAFLEQSNEVIMFEPFFDQYLPSITFNTGKPIYVPLHPNTKGSKPTSNDLAIDFDELR